ncbi:MAG: AEC family transporter, partial [Microcystaceae cyanobacterium]
SLMATALLPNNGNMGLPVVTFALGNEGLERAIIVMIGSSILLFGLMPAILRGNGVLYGIGLTLKLPLIWAMIVGVGLNLGAVELPLNLGDGIRELGRAAIPLALILLGLELSSTRLQVGKFETLATLLRLGLSPIIAFLVGQLLRLEVLDLQVLVIQCSMPTAINSLILVKEFGGDGAKVARTIVLTTLLSFLTIPLILWRL